jgi:hypothetical protein
MKKYILIVIVIGAALGVGFLTFARPRPPAATPATPVRQEAPSAAFASSTSVTIPVLRQETVLAAMQAYASSSRFTFTGTTYPSLGLFVDSIDGKTNANGYYWTLYIDGNLSELGVSSATATPGHIIQWRYQKGVQ